MPFLYRVYECGVPLNVNFTFKGKTHHIFRLFDTNRIYYFA